MSYSFIPDFHYLASELHIPAVIRNNNMVVNGIRKFTNLLLHNKMGLSMTRGTFTQVSCKTMAGLMKAVSE